MYRKKGPRSDRTRRQRDRCGAYRQRDAVRRAGRADRKKWPAVLTTVFLVAVIGAAVFFGIAHRSLLQPEATESMPLASGTPTGPENTPQAVQTAAPTGEGWLEWKQGQFVAVEYGTDISNELDTSHFIDTSTKNSHDLAEWAKMAWKNRWGYVWGTFGQILTEELLSNKLEQYPDDLREYVDIIREKWMGRRASDCVGLIKSYGWYDPATDSIEYLTHGMPDTGTDGMWDAATVKGDITTLPDEPGLLVYSTAGHIGVYIGDGYAIEAISHAGGVVKTKVADRPWTGWLQCPYVSYDS